MITSIQQYVCKAIQSNVIVQRNIEAFDRITRAVISNVPYQETVTFHIRRHDFVPQYLLCIWACAMWIQPVLKNICFIVHIILTVTFFILQHLLLEKVCQRDLTACQKLKEDTDSRHLLWGSLFKYCFINSMPIVMLLNILTKYS